MVRELFGGSAYESSRKSSPSLHAINHPDPNSDDENGALLDDEDDFDEQLMLMQSGNTRLPNAQHKTSQVGNTPKPPLACITKVLYGSCDKKGCKWSHDASLVSETRDKYLKLITEQQKKFGSSRQTPEAILTRKPSTFGRVSMMDKEDDPSSRLLEAIDEDLSESEDTK
jgi:hypothetical protein